MAHFFDQGAGKDLFGDSQKLAVDAARRLEGEILSLVVSLSDQPTGARVKQQMEDWAQQNPIEDLTFGRRSAMTDASAVTAADPPQLKQSRYQESVFSFFHAWPLLC